MRKIFILSVLSGFMSMAAVYSQQVQTFSVRVDGNQVGINTSIPVAQKQIGKAAMEFIYDYHYLTDTTNSESVVKDMMILQVSIGMSKFFSYRTMQVDSLLQVSTAEQIKANPAMYVGGEKLAVYKNYPAGKFTITDRISTDWFMYEEDIPVYEWILIDSVKEILGYNCRMAECDFRGRKYIAWYSDEIPVADGPWKFGGLPGFILEVADDKGHYSFTLTGINSKASHDIAIPDVQYNKTSREKYYNTKRKFDIDPFGYLLSVTGVNVTVNKPDGTLDDKAMRPRELQFDYIERDYK
jgi:GLPGLI family protein